MVYNFLMKKALIRWLLLLLSGLLVAAMVLYIRAAMLSAPSPATSWPWKGAIRETPHSGVTHWKAVSADGTILHLLDFDFAANPHLRLELYDQDEDDEKPFDNNARISEKGAAQVTRQLNDKGQGKVIAAWNGLFFATERTKHHVAPVVLNGKVLYNVGRVRWTVGVKYQDGKPIFKALHQPDRNTLAKEYTYAASAAQCLIKDGVPLKLKLYPILPPKQLPSPVPSTPREAGYIQTVDFLRTSRTSMAWSQDNRHFYLLTVQEPDSELISIDDFLKHRRGIGGWSLADLQRFWQSFGAWGAVNSDGGEMTEMICLRPDGIYLLIPPLFYTTQKEFILSPDFKDAPRGGTLMYFYVRDAGSK